MKKFIRYLLLLLMIGAVGGYVYWQMYKKKLVKDSIEKTLAQKTDSLYYVHYDSSFIDEVNGTAAFYKVSLQSDSAQKELLKRTDSLPNNLFNIKIEEIKATGIDVPGFLTKENVTTRLLLINKPVIQIIKTGADKPRPFSYNDTLELYEKITGKFNSIKADTIQIRNGTVLITDKNGKSLTTLENINVDLANFLVDSTRNYENLVSYFIKDVRASIENVQFPETNNKRINMGKLEYDAAKRTLHVNEIQQYEQNNMQPLIDLKNIQVNGLNTDAFIMQQQLKAGFITCDGGVITIYKKEKAKRKKNRAIEVSSNVIDEAEVAGISLGKTKVIVMDPEKPGANPFILNDVQFAVSQKVNVSQGIAVSELVSDADWDLSVGGFSVITKDKFHSITAEMMHINNRDSTAVIKRIHLKPLVSEAVFRAKHKYQQEMYDINIDNIKLYGINVKKLLEESEVEINNGVMQPVMKVYRDRTLPLGDESKVGKYPHQLLMGIKSPFFIRSMKVINGAVFYREKAEKSEMVGDVFFKKINAVITNITNMPAKIKQDPALHLDAKTLFLGKGNLSTQWYLPLSTSNSLFVVKGEMGGMNMLQLNPLIEPLSMASVKEGDIDKLVFSIKGTDYDANGDILFLYRNLKINLLKKGDEKNELKKKEVASFLANTILKNDNPKNGNTRESSVKNQRDTKKSFFNLVWKTIFAGVKKTAM